MANIHSRIKVGDTVEVVAGKDLGKKGPVLAVQAANRTCTVKDVNVVKKHVKPRGQQQGGIISMEKPISISNVMLICPSCNKRTRVGYEITKNEKHRVCKQCNIVITQTKEDTKKPKKKQ
jgi:large subunit ribosomal protein L24